MIESLTGIGAACVCGLIFFPGAYLLVRLIERYIDSCPNGSEPPPQTRKDR